MSPGFIHTGAAGSSCSDDVARAKNNIVGDEVNELVDAVLHELGIRVLHDFARKLNRHELVGTNYKTTPNGR